MHCPRHWYTDSSVEPTCTYYVRNDLFYVVSYSHRIALVALAYLGEEIGAAWWVEKKERVTRRSIYQKGRVDEVKAERVSESRGTSSLPQQPLS